MRQAFWNNSRLVIAKLLMHNLARKKAPLYRNTLIKITCSDQNLKKKKTHWIIFADAIKQKD